MGDNRTTTRRRPAFRRPGAETEFFEAYDAVLALWPVPVESLDLPSAYGTTRVQVCGPRGAPPIVLLHAGGATSTVWFANVADLSRAHRVYAIDTIGDAGRSVHDGRLLRDADDYAAWLGATFDALRLTSAVLVGHSYGAWLALSFALRAPARVGRLVLLDPTDCFAGMSLRYRLRAVPLFARPSAARTRSYLRWETGQAPLDERWLHLTALAGGEVIGSKLVLPTRPPRKALTACRVRTLQVLAGDSRALDGPKATAQARRLMPDVRSVVLPGATHHTLPMLDAPRLDAEILAFSSAS